MCSLPESRGCFVSEGAQEAVSVARLPLRQLLAGGGATTGHGGASGPQKVSHFNVM